MTQRERRSRQERQLDASPQDVHHRRTVKDHRAPQNERIFYVLAAQLPHHLSRPLHRPAHPRVLLLGVAEQRPIVVDGRVEGRHPLQLGRHHALGPEERGGDGLGLLGGRGGVIGVLGRRSAATGGACGDGGRGVACCGWWHGSAGICCSSSVDVGGAFNLIEYFAF